MQQAAQKTKAATIKRQWYLLDADKKVLGRMASDIALLLMGKNKPYYVSHLDCGDYVVVINAASVAVTGKKEKNKTYKRHSGFPGGLKVESLHELRLRKPEEIIYHAVKGMLPQNRLRDQRLKRLLIFKDTEHKYQDKFKNLE